MKITKPTLLVDEQKVRKNVRMMLAKAKSNGAELRPHFKTHHSADIAVWLREEGVTKATVSSIDMAKYFAKAGWDDITIAFPYNPLEVEEVAQLARQITLNVTIVSKEALAHLNHHVKAPINYFIKVDVGTHRTGVLPELADEIGHMAQSLNSEHTLVGLLAHAGHTYQPMTKEKAEKVFSESMKAFDEVKSIVGKEDLIISYGDTPSCSLLDDFPGVNELRPGNFVFYDIMQQYFNSCSLEEIAVCMACPVVAIHTDRNEVVVFGGAVHFSKDFIAPDGNRSFGTVVKLFETGWESEPIAHVDRLSQEHGIIKASDELIKSLKIGDLVGILPVHSCLTADLQGYYVSLAGQRLNKFNKADV